MSVDYTNRIHELPERFRSKFEIVDTGFDTPCWIWIAGKNQKGYGRFGFCGKTLMAHRFAYEMLVGPIPDGLVLDHSVVCINPSCVNPGHVEPVTNKVNALRGNGPTAVNARKVRCGNGHPLTITNRGLRECKICKADYMAEYSRKYREANIERISSRNAQNYEENKERISERHKVWRESNREYAKQYYIDHRAEMIAQAKANYAKRKDLKAI